MGDGWGLVSRFSCGVSPSLTCNHRKLEVPELLLSRGCSVLYFSQANEEVVKMRGIGLLPTVGLTGIWTQIQSRPNWNIDLSKVWN